MAASDHLGNQWIQTDLWKPARELRGMRMDDVYVDLSRKGLSSADPENVKRSRRNVVRRKLKESKKSGLYESIKREGVKEPVGLYHTRDWSSIYEGHHRVASAMAIDPKMLVPVEHVFRRNRP